MDISERKTFLPKNVDGNIIIHKLILIEVFLNLFPVVSLR